MKEFSFFTLSTSTSAPSIKAKCSTYNSSYMPSSSLSTSSISLSSSWSTSFLLYLILIISCLPLCPSSSTPSIYCDSTKPRWASTHSPHNSKTSILEYFKENAPIQLIQSPKILKLLLVNISLNTNTKPSPSGQAHINALHFKIF